MLSGQAVAVQSLMPMQLVSPNTSAGEAEDACAATNPAKQVLGITATRRMNKDESLTASPRRDTHVVCSDKDKDGAARFLQIFDR